MWKHPHLHLGDIVGVCSLESPRSLRSTDEVGRNILLISTHGGIADLFWGYIVVFLGMRFLAESVSMQARCSPRSRSLNHSAQVAAQLLNAL